MTKNSLISSLSIAPMIDWSYSHFRMFMRLLAPSSLIYTEMQTTGAIEHNPQRALQFNPFEQPVALQLGGSDKHHLALCAKKAELQGYHEVNLNLGCPSDKVQAGRFGACLMTEPLLVSDCLKAMKDAVNIPVTAKTRIGIDKQDSYAFFSDFVHTLVDAGIDKLIVHARKAWLKGLNPKQNRTIPPINYEFVYRIKQEFPALPVVVNGNINSFEQIAAHLETLDGVMLGRLACQNPYAIALIDQLLSGTQQVPSRSAIIKVYFDYMLQAFEQGEKPGLLIKPIFNFAHGLPKAIEWKTLLMAMIQEKHLTNLKPALQWMKDIETANEVA